MTVRRAEYVLAVRGLRQSGWRTGAACCRGRSSYGRPEWPEQYWRKANPPGRGFEGALAVDLGCCGALPRRLREVLDRLEASDGRRLRKEALRWCAGTRRTSAPHVAGLASPGVPVVPTRTPSEVFEALWPRRRLGRVTFFDGAPRSSRTLS
ncbi:hypothetical protein [Streptomyces sp. CA-253872]|uniref:hypothetical protein n=1 Tax=Streptomyces sp. CA-253872 TaxID=3240067 RepID=UPI003D8F09F3